MRPLEFDPIWLSYISSLNEEILIKKLLISHDPDARLVESHMLLHTVENVIRFGTPSQELVSDFDPGSTSNDKISSTEVVGSQEPLAHTTCNISLQMLSRFSGGKDLHARSMMLFELLRNYRWGDKVVLVLTAFAKCYGELWLLRQLYSSNPLAKSVAILKGLSNDISKFKHQLKTLNLLAKAMIDVAKCIIKFEGLPLENVKLDDEMVAATKSQIYMAAYWVIRSALTCSSQITDLRALKPESLNSTIAAWELSSLVYRLSSRYSLLRRQVEACHQQIEKKIYQKLQNLFKETHVDNQGVLHMLLALNDDLPFRDCSKLMGVSELKNKIVILLISKPELLPSEELFFLVQQTYDHPYHLMIKGNYEIIWVPISSHGLTWTDAEQISFSFLSNSLPWYSLRKPHLLNSSVVNFIQTEFSYKGKPIMVVLDSQGKMTNSNALDMTFIWGARAYPFSVSRENELWEGENWSLQLLIDDIDPLLAKLIKEGRNVCIYGSKDLEWIGEFNGKMKEIQNAGMQLEMVYTGKKNPDEEIRSILLTANRNMHRNLLSFRKLHLFWIRLESMRRSRLRPAEKANTDHILEQVSEMLDFDDSQKGWALIGKGSSTDIIKLSGNKLREFLNKFPDWGEHVRLMGASRTAIETPLHAEPCGHTSVIPYTEESMEESVACEKCKHPLKKFIVYQ
ncbi:protein SIEVE ELEMENT OCCLUSION C isoform X2 [Carica papaya]|uniref:protein SIEVE ELEMENT OCCLUSION C isoform X2 n=1 Tax=Carica papaya TaxID=3649 RepID=UPI000B8D0FEB|nr:protein SIEVE ELEMENT OCCLUSION C isoform X2 [Carica papaya]